MEDFRVDVVVGKGPGATAIPLDVEPFTLVGATTRAGPADRADARPVRLRRAPGLLRAGRAGARAARGRRGSSACRSPRTARRRSPAGRAARRGSPTGCCAGSATTPRCAPTAWSTWTTARAALRVYDVDDARPGPARPGGAARAGRVVRRRAGGPVDAGRGGGGAAGHGRGGVRAVPGAGRAAGAYAARAGWPPPAAWRHLGLTPPPSDWCVSSGESFACDARPVHRRDEADVVRDRDRDLCRMRRPRHTD